MKPANVFISYSHKDEAFKDELLEFLSPLKRAGEITIWNDRAILVGDKWNAEITKALDECDLIMFMLSPSFLASDFINDVEIARAMKRHHQDKVRLVPVMIRECDVKSHIIPLEPYRILDFQGLPTNMKPISNWQLRDEAWMDVIRGLKPVIQLIRQTKN